MKQRGSGTSLPTPGSAQPESPGTSGGYGRAPSLPVAVFLLVLLRVAAILPYITAIRARVPHVVAAVAPVLAQVTRVAAQVAPILPRILQIAILHVLPDGPCGPA